MNVTLNIDAESEPSHIDRTGAFGIAPARRISPQGVKPHQKKRRKIKGSDAV